MPKLLDGYRARSTAEEDRSYGNYQCERRLTATLGAPPFANDPPPDQMVQVERERIQELTIQVQQLGLQRAKQPPLLPLLGIGGTIATGEWIGFVLLTKDLGIENPQRLVLAFLLMVAAIFLTYKASRQ